MSEEKRYTSFEEFWPFYVKEHSKKTTRTLHAVGTMGALALLGAALLKRKPALALLAPVCGYGFAWVSHFFIEKNVPATFTYPAWSFKGDFVMLSKVLTGTMDAEVERVMAKYAADAEAARHESNGHGPTPRPAVSPTAN